MWDKGDFLIKNKAYCIHKNEQTNPKQQHYQRELISIMIIINVIVVVQIININQVLTFSHETL
jgi:hypothetical protein